MESIDPSVAIGLFSLMSGIFFTVLTYRRSTTDRVLGDLQDKYRRVESNNDMLLKENMFLRDRLVELEKKLACPKIRALIDQNYNRDNR